MNTEQDHNILYFTQQRLGTALFLTGSYFSNPKGRTGLKGRGCLWRWGPNHTGTHKHTHIHSHTHTYIHTHTLTHT